jgi:hypothetical protein
MNHIIRYFTIKKQINICLIILVITHAIYNHLSPFSSKKLSMYSKHAKNFDLFEVSQSEEYQILDNYWFERK